MTTFEFVTQWATIISPLIAIYLAWWTIKSSNKSTSEMLKYTRENSRVSSSEHLSLYRIEAFYNEVEIRNIQFDIQTIERQILKEKDSEELEKLQRQLEKLKMNLGFRKIRNSQLIQNDFALQKELNGLFQKPQ